MQKIIDALNELRDGYLDISGLNLIDKNIPDSPKWAQVRHLNISNNSLTILPYCPLLETLECANNKLRHLPELRNVYKINCANNNISVINGYDKLITLNCAGNPVKLGQLPALENLTCHDCGLNELDISIYPYLDTLNAANNYLTSIQNHACLRNINISNNRLIEIPAFPVAESVAVNYNKLRCVPVWNVISLEIDYNLLETFPSSDVLQRLSCCNNNIRLNADNIQPILSALKYLDCSNGIITEPFIINKCDSKRRSHYIVARDAGLHNTDMLETINYTMHMRPRKNKITVIPHLPSLQHLVCENIGLQIFPVGEFLETINCSHNDLMYAKWPIWPRIRSISANYCRQHEMPPISVTTTPSLTELYMNHCELTVIPDGSLGRLNIFDCSYNNIVWVSDDVIKLNDFIASYNMIKKVPPFWPNTNTINISHNEISGKLVLDAPNAMWIDLSHNPGIIGLDIIAKTANRIMCNNCDILELNITADNLLSFHCNNNRIEILDVYAPNLRELLAQFNNIEISPEFDKLRILNIEGNNVRELRQYPQLARLNCAGNEIMMMHDSNLLSEVNCSRNKIMGKLPSWPNIKDINYEENPDAIRGDWPDKTHEIPARIFKL